MKWKNGIYNKNIKIDTDDTYKYEITVKTDDYNEIIRVLSNHGIWWSTLSQDATPSGTINITIWRSYEQI